MTKFVYLSFIDIVTDFVKNERVNEVKRDKVLAAARDVFLRYGYRRVSMHDIGEAAAISRPALYNIFKNKEQIFIGVMRRWTDETIAEIERIMTSLPTPGAQLERAFEIWTVGPFEMTLQSPEAKELIDCGFAFAQESLSAGYAKFEATIVPVLASLDETPPAGKRLPPEALAHVLASAVRGFKQTATTTAELRLLISQLLTLALERSAVKHKPS